MLLKVRSRCSLQVIRRFRADALRRQDKSLAHPLADSPPPAPLAADLTSNETTRKRGREDAGTLDLTEDAETAEPPAKRTGAELDELVVKDEEVDPVLPPWPEIQEEYDDYKPDLQDLKPELRVDCEHCFVSLAISPDLYTNPCAQIEATPSSTAPSSSCELMHCSFVLSEASDHSAQSRTVSRARSFRTSTRSATGTG